MASSQRDAAGDVLLKFAETEEGGPESFSERATLSRHEGGGRGTTSVHFEHDGMVGDEKFDIAFNADHFLRDDGRQKLCLDRNNFDQTAWRYGLYDAETGARINPKSGFPVKVTQDGREYYGWIGYWGLWFPEEVSLENGATVYKQDFSSDEEVPYTLFIANGKLRKHTKMALTLADVKNVPLDNWDDKTQQQSRVIWDGTVFKTVATFNEETGVWTDLQPPVAMDLSALRYDTLHFWSHALGGNVRIKLTCTESEPPAAPAEPWELTFACTADSSAVVVLYAETVIYPGDGVPSGLACFGQCPNGANNDTENLYFDTAELEWQDVDPASATYISYTFDETSMLLMHGGTPIVQTVENQFHPWGIHSGPLFEPTPANLAKLVCEWNDGGTSTCGWQAWEKLDEYYTWESGPEEWSSFTALKNGAGELERFEPPLPVQYTHSQLNTGAPDHKYHGTTFHLEYNGFGDLHGIPGKCVDMHTGEDVSCGHETRWIPEFTIPDGAELQGDGETYLCKALEKEQRMRSVDLADCAALHLVSYELPKLAEWKPPKIGNPPAVDGPPAVVGGVIQE
jgi:hypothetical protein